MTAVLAILIAVPMLGQSGKVAAEVAAQQTTGLKPSLSFDVATIKPVESNAKSARFLMMQGTHRFVVKDYTLKALVAAAYNLSPRTISGGPSWTDSDHYDILAVTPGDAPPSRPEQMLMLRSLLADRFQLGFHREQRVFSIYALEVAKNGPKLKPSTAPADQPPALVSVVYPQRMVMPARNATMTEFAEILQRAVLDRPVVDRTGLAGRYDFDLTWAPDETQFGGDVPAASSDAPSPPFFTAVQEQLGLRLEATRGPVDALIIDRAEQPSAN